MKYCKEMTDKICKLLAKGSGRVSACEQVNIHYCTFLEWMKIPEFAEAVKKAEEQEIQWAKGRALKSIYKAMGTQWQAGAWFLERKFKDEYAKQENVMMSRPLQDMSDEDLERAIKRRKDISSDGDG